MNIKEKTKALTGKVKTGVTNIGKYWKNPKEGEYVSYSEFTRFVIGAGAANTATYAGNNLSFTAGCLFVGAIYGLKMMDFVMLGLVGVILSYLFSPIGMIITDNLGRPPKKTMRLINWASFAFLVIGITCFFVPQSYFEDFMPALPQVVGTKFILQFFATYYNIFVLRVFSKKFGKYRSWLIAGMLPYTLSLFLLTWFPYNSFDYHTKFWVMHFFFSLNGCFVNCFNQVSNVQNVISPNTNERTKIMSIGSFLYSLIPSIYNIIFPIVATKVGGMTNINTYKYVIPITILILAPLSLFLVFGVKDRVVQEEEHRPEVNMRKGFKEVLRNKYLWITNTSNLIASFAVGSVNIVNMLIIYSLRKDWVIGIMMTILGTAWTPGMLLAPILIKKFGKKRIMLFGKYCQFFCSFISVAGVYLDSFFLIILSTYISTVITSVLDITTKSMTADIWDYQQYISGERLDGCMGIFNYIFSPFITLVSMLIPYLYGRVGFTSDWNILYDPILRNKIFMITLIVGAVFGLLAIIPYHFYNFTEQRHEEMMEEMRQRISAKKEDAQTRETEEDASTVKETDSVTTATV